ncbi:MAG: glycine cleavage system protein H [Chlorobi bacterium]|nr:glycine cleavage system protein H [Chlorobiota bacterium]
MKKLKFWKTITWAIIVFILSSLPGSDFDEVPFFNIPYFDKLVHFGMYAVLTFIFLFELNNNSFSTLPKIKAIVLIGFVSISYGLLLEILQKYLFTERSAELADFIANTIGCLVAIFAFLTTTRKYHRQ